MSDKTTVLMLTITLLLTTLGTGILYLSRNRDIFSPLPWCAVHYSILFGFRSLYCLFASGSFIGGSQSDPQTMASWILALLLAHLGWLTFLIGYTGRLASLVARWPPPLPRRWSASRAKLVSSLAFAVGLIALVVFISRASGGLGQALSTSRHKLLTSTGTAYLTELSMLVWYGFLASYVANRGLTALTATYGVVTVLGLGVFLGSKALTFTPVLSAIIARHYLAARVSFRRLIWFFAVVTIAIIPFNAFRHSVEPQQVVGLTASTLARPGSAIEAVLRRFYGIECLTIIVRETGTTLGYQLGATWSPVLFSWIPRSLWDSKPTVSFARVFGETYLGEWFAGTGTAVAPTLLGDGYVNFHIAGVVLVSYAAGVIVSTLYRYLVARGGVSGTYVYAAMSQYLLGGFWEGDVAGLLTRSVFRLALVVAISLLARTAGGASVQQGRKVAKRKG